MRARRVFSLLLKPGDSPSARRPVVRVLVSFTINLKSRASLRIRRRRRTQINRDATDARASLRRQRDLHASQSILHHASFRPSVRPSVRPSSRLTARPRTPAATPRTRFRRRTRRQRLSTPRALEVLATARAPRPLPRAPRTSPGGASRRPRARPRRRTGSHRPRRNLSSLPRARARASVIGATRSSVTRETRRHSSTDDDDDDDDARWDARRRRRRTARTERSDSTDDDGTGDGETDDEGRKRTTMRREDAKTRMI
jgi:hypothetical protein